MPLSAPWHTNIRAQFTTTRTNQQTNEANNQTNQQTNKQNKEKNCANLMRKTGNPNVKRGV
uniref:Uncharacterized protein n=1 Tax=Anguilla anguilla TaxID=7936 RepID=A0A0E9Q6B9_ANGAN